MSRANIQKIQQCPRMGWVLTLLWLWPACALSDRQQDDWPDANNQVSVAPTNRPSLVPSDGGAPSEDSGSCVAQTDQELCTQYTATCGTLAGFDSCGDWREVGSCGTCAADQHCVGNGCLAWSYDWLTTAWSPCSASCGGGTRTRDVTCGREDGVLVADIFCTGTAPPDTETCNPAPCVNCAAIHAANPEWVVCQSGPSFCAGVFNDGDTGTTCHDFCAPVGLPCTARHGGGGGTSCIKEATTFACGADTGHISDWCECGTP